MATDLEYSSKKTKWSFANGIMFTYSGRRASGLENLQRAAGKDQRASLNNLDTYSEVGVIPKNTKRQSDTANICILLIDGMSEPCTKANLMLSEKKCHD